MNEQLASQIVTAAVSLDKALGEIDVAISAISDEVKRRKFAKYLGDIIGQINDSLIRPLVKEFPHLEPVG